MRSLCYVCRISVLIYGRDGMVNADSFNTGCFKRPHLLLLIFWSTGFLFGTLLSLLFSFEVSNILFSELQEQTTLGLCAVLLFPLLLSYCLNRWNACIYLLVFFKAMIFAYSCGIIHRLFQVSGWIVVLLSHFSDIFFLPFLFRFWIAILSKRSLEYRKVFIICIISAFLLAVLDLYFVSPLVRNLLIT